MNNYLIKVVHPELGEIAEVPGSGNNALEALEDAHKNGLACQYGVVHHAYVKNVSTGFTTRIEFGYD